MGGERAAGAAVTDHCYYASMLLAACVLFFSQWKGCYTIRWTAATSCFWLIHQLNSSFIIEQHWTAAYSCSYLIHRFMSIHLAVWMCTCGCVLRRVPIITLCSAQSFISGSRQEPACNRTKATRINAGTLTLSTPCAPKTPSNWRCF
jgi:hypothetical protein